MLIMLQMQYKRSFIVVVMITIMVVGVEIELQQCGNVFSDIRFRGCRSGRRVARMRQRQEHSVQSEGAGDPNGLDVTTAKLDNETATLARATHLFITDRELALNSSSNICCYWKTEGAMSQILSVSGVHI